MICCHRFSVSSTIISRWSHKQIVVENSSNYLRLNLLKTFFCCFLRLKEFLELFQHQRVSRAPSLGLQTAYRGFSWPVSNSQRGLILQSFASSKSPKIANKFRETKKRSEKHKYRKLTTFLLFSGFSLPFVSLSISELRIVVFVIFELTIAGPTLDRLDCAWAPQTLPVVWYSPIHAAFSSQQSCYGCWSVADFRLFFSLLHLPENLAFYCFRTRTRIGTRRGLSMPRVVFIGYGQ